MRDCNPMKSETIDKAIDFSAAAPETLITIMGENAFNNELLANFLNEQTGITCCCTDLNNFKSAIDPAGYATSMVFLDCTGIDRGDLWPLLDIYRKSTDDNHLLVLDHVLYEWQIENQALDIGVRGILYDRHDLEFYPRVVRAILDGELWFPRKILERCLLDESAPPPMSKAHLSPLTMREKEILCLVARGLTNQEIAKKLCISPHTVKTHTYNIYKKINVSNRLHATLWLSGKNRNSGEK
jgi:DNA-binding NarL/FixJ family response regulator